MPARRKTTKIKLEEKEVVKNVSKKRLTRSRGAIAVTKKDQECFQDEVETSDSESDWEASNESKRPKKRSKLSSPKETKSNNQQNSTKFSPFSAVVNGRLNLSEDESSDEESPETAHANASKKGQTIITSQQNGKRKHGDREITAEECNGTSNSEGETLTKGKQLPKSDLNINCKRIITSKDNKASTNLASQVSTQQKAEDAMIIPDTNDSLSSKASKCKQTSKKRGKAATNKSEKINENSTNLSPKPKRSQRQSKQNKTTETDQSNNDDVDIKTNSQAKQRKGRQPKRPSQVLSENLMKSKQKTEKGVVPSARKKRNAKEDADELESTATFSIAGPSTSKDTQDDDDSEDTQDDWEDVDEKPVVPDDNEASPSKRLHKKEVEISVAVKSLHVDKKAKRRQQLLDAIERCARKYKQEQKNYLHKVHLLCLVARGRFYSNLCNHFELKAMCLSLVPSVVTRVPINKWNIAHTKRVIEWFKESMPSPSNMLQLLPSNESKKLEHITETHLFVTLLRSLGLMARLICSLQPVTWKVTTKTKKTSPKQLSSVKRKLSSSSAKKPPSKKTASSDKKPAASNTANPTNLKSPYFAEKTSTKSPTTKGKPENSNEDNLPLAQLKRIKKVLNYKEAELSDEEQSDRDNDSRKEKKKLSNEKDIDYSMYRTVADKFEAEYKHRINKKLVAAIDDDEAFESTSKPVLTSTSKKTSTKAGVSMLSSSSSESSLENIGLSDGSDLWIEAYLPAEKKWICIELSTPSLNEVTVHEKIASKPVQYIVAFDNDLSIKDVTCRYDSKWLSQTRRQRIDREWWAEVIDLYPPKQKKIDKAEDAELHSRLLEQPLPKSISEFKGHALFVLERHLLKYEAIYPRTATTVGFIRGEAVYARDCVHTLHSRENWMMEALVVRSGEEPYKIVRGRPKKNTPIHERDNVKLELFGKWQTDIYKPPRAKNGIVPKNEYGNVELFKPCMLPPGTVHVPIQGIQKVARKLKIDVAPAMMGWDFHGGHCHPIIEGVVVCKEFKQQLIDGWNKDEDDIKRKANEKREKKIFDRWRHIIKSMLVKERLSKKYDFEVRVVVHMEEATFNVK